VDESAADGGFEGKIGLVAGFELYSPSSKRCMVERSSSMSSDVRVGLVDGAEIRLGAGPRRACEVVLT